MEYETIVHQSTCRIAEKEYEICVFSRDDGRLFARTVLAPQDVIISDGPSLADVLRRHQELLPLAIKSRVILKEMSRPS